MSPDGFRVLLLEDSPVDARLIQAYLTADAGAPVQITHVVRLSQALDELAAADFDVALTDLTVPDSAGFETFEALHAASPELPIVVLTGLDDDRVALQALGAGAQDYLVKNDRLDPDLLVRSLRYAVERKRLEQGLRERAAELAEALRAQDEFLAVISHELRTPLDAILGWTRLLQQGQLDEAERREAIDAVARNAEVQTRLVGDLIDLAALSTGKVRLRLREIAFDEVVRWALDAERPSADAKKIRLDARFDDKLPPVAGDGDRLRRIVSNLLANAVKFTADGGRVEVAVTTDGPNVRLAVSDSGIGLAPEVVPRVFDRFWQGDAPDGQSPSGLGLGLAIVRGLTELHGGTVSARSPGIGQGATFLVTLPAATPSVAERAPSPGGLRPS